MFTLADAIPEVKPAAFTFDAWVANLATTADCAERAWINAHDASDVQLLMLGDLAEEADRAWNEADESSDPEWLDANADAMAEDAELADLAESFIRF